MPLCALIIYAWIMHYVLSKKTKYVPHSYCSFFVTAAPKAVLKIKPLLNYIGKQLHNLTMCKQLNNYVLYAHSSTCKVNTDTHSQHAKHCYDLYQNFQKTCCWHCCYWILISILSIGHCYQSY